MYLHMITFFTHLAVFSIVFLFVVLVYRLTSSLRALSRLPKGKAFQLFPGHTTDLGIPDPTFTYLDHFE